MQDNVVHVSAPARLHLGFLDPGASFGRRFGGIGLAIDRPQTALSVARAARTSVAGPESARVERLLAGLVRHLGIAPGHRVTVEDAIPAHAGLGSGTQIALALAAAVRRLEGLPMDIEGDAAALGRGLRSGLGTAFFDAGGLAVDGGKGESETPPPLVARFAFPEDWRVILVADERRIGVHGQAELDAFAALPPFPRAGAGEIAALTLMQVMPGLLERDIAAFGAAIARIQRLVGEHFAPAQGGIFTSPGVARCLQALSEAGAHGIGQSSWGPTGFAFVESAAAGEACIGAARETGAAEGLRLTLACGRNTGARIEVRKAQRLAGLG